MARGEPLESKMTEKYWSRFPDTYDSNQEYVVGKELLDQITETLDGLPELGSAVELGCGTGYFTEEIARKCKSIVATDLSDSLLEVARIRLREHQEVTIQKEDCMETTFPFEAFDSVFMANLIHVVENPSKALRECHRILGDDGAIVIVTFTGYGMKLWEKIKMGARFSRAWGRPPSHAHSFSPEQVTSMMEDAGFIVETSKLIGERTKALYAIGRKNSERQDRDRPGADA
jgi:ABC-2 type transport system ATP-binding protein